MAPQVAIVGIVVNNPVINPRQAWLGIALLGIGALGYLIDQAENTVWFVQELDLPRLVVGNGVGVLAAYRNHAPDFLHPLAFSLLSMSLFTTTVARISACLTWIAIDLVCEFGQGLGEWVAAVRGGYDEPAIFSLFEQFVQRGTFDPVDVIAIVAGGATAASLDHLLASKGEYRANPQEG